jgi:multicomponent Na+:H+ antiporter subunit C
VSPPSLVILVVVAGLFAAGFHLLLQRSLMRVVLGFTLLGHGANLALLAAGGPPGAPPVDPAHAEAPVADPLPQAMALTAIVITFGVSALLLALVFRAVRLTGDDEVPEGDERPADRGGEAPEEERAPEPAGVPGAAAEDPGRGPGRGAGGGPGRGAGRGLDPGAGGGPGRGAGR